MIFYLFCKLNLDTYITFANFLLTGNLKMSIYIFLKNFFNYTFENFCNVIFTAANFLQNT